MDIRREDGIAMLVAMMAMLLMMRARRRAGADDLVGNDDRRQLPGQQEALYAADAALERSIGDLLTLRRIGNPVLDGSAAVGVCRRARPAGSRTLRDGSTIDLGAGAQHGELPEARGVQRGGDECGHAGPALGCEQPALAALRLRPSERACCRPGNQFAVLRDGHGWRRPVGERRQSAAGRREPRQSGRGVIAMRAEAFGPRGAHAAIESTVARIGAAELDGGRRASEILSWRQRR